MGNRIELIRSLWERLRSPAAVVALYYGIRLVAVLVARTQATSWTEMLGGRYDSIWLEQIATQGYDQNLPLDDPDAPTSNTAFFPLFPLVLRLVWRLTPLSPELAGVAVAWLAGGVAAWGLLRLAEAWLGTTETARSMALCWVAAWACLPHALIESSAYTESMFTALAIWALVWVHRNGWLAALAICIAAGLTRPTGLVVAGAVSVAALVVLVKARGRGWRVWLAMLGSPLGWAGFVSWVGWRFGSIDAYFKVQAMWGTSVDGGRYTLTEMWHIMSGVSSRLGFYVITALLLGSLVLLVVSALDRQPLPWLIYSAGMLILTASTATYYWSKGRFMLPAICLLAPIAWRLARARRSIKAVALVVGLAVTSYYGTYIIALWPSSP